MNMENIELVIKMPKEYYKAITEIPDHQCTADMLIIKSGTPLPKGHGRLIDANEVEKLEEALCATECECCGLDGCFYDEAETIIEADKKYEAKVITRGNCMICGKELTEGLFFCKECGRKSK